MIDANDLERMAKARPDECFLKGSGVLKLIDAVRQLERQQREGGLTEAYAEGRKDESEEWMKATGWGADRAPARRERCKYCDDTGDVQSLTGEWRGTCTCPAGAAMAERDRFEAFMRRSRTGKGAKKAAALLNQHPNGEYVEDHVQRHWWTWQLALGLAKLHTEEGGA